jgi:acetyl-CoA acetyltransferase/uncharacterized OB-fold protein
MADPLLTAKRALPEISPWTTPFWTGGSEGELRLPSCPVDGKRFHPSEQICPDHPSEELVWVAVGPTATVLGMTVNVQQFLPGFTPPYVIAIVDLDGAPGVRLTTNLVNLEPESAHVGQRVTVLFVEQSGTWFPLFTPNGEPDDPTATDVPLPQVQAPPQLVSGEPKFEDKVVISGIGISQVGRRLLRPPISLTSEACAAALADAGLTAADIDGLATWPGATGGGMSEGGVGAVQEAMGINPVWHSGAMETSGQTGAIVSAMLAVASGLCKHVLCFRTVWEASYSDLTRSGKLSPGGGDRVGGWMQWRIPYGASSAANWIGMHASQYMARYGVGREMLGRVAVNARTNAALNPIAVYKDPMTIEDYYAARMVTTPFGLYDCDVPCDGSVAIIISAVDTIPDLACTPIRIDAVGTAVTERQSWDQATMTHEPMVFGPAAHLWTRTSLKHSDVDFAELYDGFTFNCVSWLEALGFCGIGEATDYIGDGKRIALHGELPLNTHGGQLSGGRTHGFGFVYEGVTQLRGEAGARQVPDAKVGVISTGGGLPGGCFLLRRE